MLCLGGRLANRQRVLGKVRKMAEDTSPVLCQAIGEEKPRGLTGRNTKRKTSDGEVLENTYEDCIKKRLRRDNPRLTHFGADARLCSSDKLIAAGNLLPCKDCVIDNRAKEMISADKSLDKCANKI